jgi:hypothetical protein
MSSTFLSNLNLLTQSLSFSTPPCKYYSDLEFRDGCSRLDSKDNFKIFHLNIRSLNANNTKLYQFMAALNFPFDAIILSEIWSFNISMYSNLFLNCNFFYALLKNSSIGGVGVFISNSFKVTRRDDLIQNFCFSNNSADILFLEITKNNFKCLLGNFYRHPSSNISQFTSNLELIFQSVLFRKFKSCCFLVGDLNVDLLKYDTNNEVSRFVDLLISFNFSRYLFFLPV